MTDEKPTAIPPIIPMTEALIAPTTYHKTNIQTYRTIVCETTEHSICIRAHTYYTKLRFEKNYSVTWGTGFVLTRL